MFELRHRVDPRWWLALIIGLGLGLRFWGIAWGLPGRTDMHPDEHDYVLQHALHLGAGHLDPGFLNYPAFVMYLIAGTFRGLGHLGLISGADWQAFLIGRVWSALFATATILPVYKLARELGGSVRAALLAALWMGLLPLGVWEAHVAITDPLMTFWTAMTLWASVRLARTSRLHDYLLAGACLGLATGSKYTAAMAVVAIIAGANVAFHRNRSFAEACAGLWVAAVMAVLCAYCVTPYSFIRFGDLASAMAYENSHTHGHHAGFSLPAHGWHYRRYLYQLVAAWPFSLGFALYGSAVAGTCWAVWKFDRRKLPLLAFVALFFGVTGSWHFVPLRYYLPLLVVGVLFAGLWHGALLESPRKSVRAFGLVIVPATLAYTALFTVQTTARYSHDTRVEAGKWLEQNLRHGGNLALCGWSRYVAYPGNLTNYNVLGGRDDRLVGRLQHDDPYDLVETTSMHRARHFRHAETNWINAYNHLDSSNGDFDRVARFESHFVNKRLYQRLDPMFGGYFISPTLDFYRPKHHAGLTTSELLH